MLVIGPCKRHLGATGVIPFFSTFMPQYKQTDNEKGSFYAELELCSMHSLNNTKILLRNDDTKLSIDTSGWDFT
jgi:hypothetical protein